MSILFVRMHLDYLDCNCIRLRLDAGNPIAPMTSFSDPWHPMTSQNFQDICCHKKNTPKQPPKNVCFWLHKSGLIFAKKTSSTLIWFRHIKTCRIQFVTCILPRILRQWGTGARQNMVLRMSATVFIFLSCVFFFASLRLTRQKVGLN